MGFFPSSFLFYFFVTFKYLCIDIAPLTLPKTFRTDANS